MSRENPFQPVAGSHQDKFVQAAKAKGLDYWLEQGEVMTSPPVDDSRFGDHKFGDGSFGLGSCIFGCGCYMGQSHSSGPVNPFGPCPKNPKG